MPSDLESRLAALERTFDGLDYQPMPREIRIVAVDATREGGGRPVPGVEDLVIIPKQIPPPVHFRRAARGK